MAKRMSLSVRISVIDSAFVAVLLGLVTLVIGLRLSTDITHLVKDENLQIATARAAISFSPSPTARTSPRAAPRAATPTAITSPRS
jgi:sensor histidine kinase regulating citrate/malate metabolism